jgi:hypothetical protein
MYKPDRYILYLISIFISNLLLIRDASASILGPFISTVPPPSPQRSLLGLMLDKMYVFKPYGAFVLHL